MTGSSNVDTMGEEIIQVTFKLEICETCVRSPFSHSSSDTDGKIFWNSRGRPTTKGKMPGCLNPHTKGRPQTRATHSSLLRGININFSGVKSLRFGSIFIIGGSIVLTNKWGLL